MISVNDLLVRAVAGEFLSPEEAMLLYNTATTSGLMFAANEIRKAKHPENAVTWIIDRNMNYTNVCMSGCKFCNFYRGKNHREAYITPIEEYKQKIDELFALGGDQLLLQGGMHPDLGLEFYINLFRSLKELYPKLKLHTLGPPEVHHIAKMEGLPYHNTLKSLVDAGLDSLPGAGAEILVDRVRAEVSKNKCTATEWLEVMHEAHKLDLITSATMMFGHIETREERIQHILAIRDTQESKPANVKGFISFIPWPFQDENTTLAKRYNVKNTVTPEEYIRIVALARILLPNVDNIQASWLTVGKHTAQICLHGGANDFGSIMIEENVVSVAGANYSFNAEGIQKAIKEAGFEPRRRNQRFEIIG